jgi:hypothetical protein
MAMDRDERHGLVPSRRGPSRGSGSLSLTEAPYESRGRSRSNGGRNLRLTGLPVSALNPASIRSCATRRLNLLSFLFDESSFVRPFLSISLFPVFSFNFDFQIPCRFGIPENNPSIYK